MRLPNRDPLWGPNRNGPPIDSLGLAIGQSGVSIDQSLVLANRVEHIPPSDFSSRTIKITKHKKKTKNHCSQALGYSSTYIFTHNDSNHTSAFECFWADQQLRWNKK
jgi:hypothetical protein